MAFSTYNISMGIASDTQFRVKAQAVHDILSAGGWVQTADTGQITISSAIKPAVAGNMAGYEIWRMADSLQATAPIFLKIFYGTGTTSGITGFGMNLQLGEGSNGTGTLTGAVTVQNHVDQGSTSANTQWHFLSASPSRLQICMPSSTAIPAQLGMHISIGRFNSTAGVETAEGAYQLMASAYGTRPFVESLLQKGAGVPTPAMNTNEAQTLVPSLAGANHNTGTMPLGLQVYPYVPMHNRLYPPALGHVFGYSPAFQYRGVYGVTAYESTRNYVNAGLPVNAQITGNGSGSLITLMRYE